MGYEFVETLNAEHNIKLARDTSNNELFVIKELEVFDFDVYEFLMNHPIDRTPKIKSITKNDSTITVVEEFISGVNLQSFLDNRRRIEFKAFITFLIQISSVLEKLHTSSFPIVHRDIKPSNIVISENGAYLIDFNAAKEYVSRSNQTSDTTLLGTHGYAAPEQYGFGVSTPRTDIYALGILIKTFLNQELIVGTKYQLKSLLNVSNRCTEIKSSERFPSAKALKERLVITKKSFSNSIIKSDFLRYFSLNYSLPGFRRKSILNAIVATFFYAFLIFASLTLTTVDPASNLVILWDRICFFVIVMSLVLVTFNYRDIQRFFPFYSAENILVRILGIVLLDSAVFAALMIIFVLGYNFIFKI